MKKIKIELEHVTRVGAVPVPSYYRVRKMINAATVNFGHPKRPISIGGKIQLTEADDFARDTRWDCTIVEAA